MKKKTFKKGFTLVELIVVIAIVGILAVIAVPRVGGFSEKAKQAADKQAAITVANAAAMYHAANPTDTEIKVSDLTGANLITTDDVKLVSAFYTTASKTAIVDTDIVLNGDSVTVTIAGDADGTEDDYTITK